MTKILINKETVELALEALILNNYEWKSLADSGDSGQWAAKDQGHYKITEAAIEANKKALEQSTEQETETCMGCNGIGVVGNILDTDICPFCEGSGIEQSTQEPMVYELADKVRIDLDRQSCPGVFMNIAWESIVKNYTPQPQEAAPRELLSDEHKMQLVTNWFSEDYAVKKAMGLLRDYDYELKAANVINGKEPRKPLTDEQRNWIVATCPTPRHIIDTVEKMHGIKE